MQLLRHKNEYDSFSLGRAPLTPVLAFAIPVLGSTFSSVENSSLPNTQIFILMGLATSVFLLFLFSPFRSLFLGNKVYRYLVISIYSIYWGVPYTLFYFLPYSALAELIGSVVIGLGICTTFVFHMYWFSAAKLEPLGWYTKEKIIEPEGPAGSPIGNFLAILLGVILIGGALGIFGKMALHVIELSQ